MAYRRKQVTRSTTFVEEFRSPPPPPPYEPSSAAVAGDVGGDGNSSSSSLAAQAIRASAAHRDSSSLSSAYGDSAFTSSASAGGEANRFRRSATYTSSRDAATYEYTSMRSLNESKYGFWGVLARKAKSILEDDNASQQQEDHGRSRQQMLETRTGGQFNRSYPTPDSYRKTENSTFNRSSEAISSSLHHIGGTIKNAFEEGLTIVESRTADIIQETRKLQIRRKTGSPNALNVATDLSALDGLSPKQNDHETQLKASRDVANAMAAKAKLLLRELKTVKADLAFAQERCTQLEEENKLLRESREKGDDHHEDEDLIRLQLETLLEEKGRLAHENSVYARENRFLREIVEYHQLTMQDVIYVDEGIEEVSEVCPIPMSPHSSRNSSAALPPINSRSASPTRPIKILPPSLNDKDVPEDIEDNTASEKKGTTPPSPKAKGLRRQRSSTPPS